MKIPFDAILATELVEAFQQMETNHDWDLSTGEIARLVEAFYPHFATATEMPRSVDELDAIFEAAYDHTWGTDHECDKTKPEEMRTLLLALHGSITSRGESSIKQYIDGIGLKW